MSRRNIRELSSPMNRFLIADKETQKKWLRKGGKRRIRRMERRESKQRAKEFE